MKQLHFIFGLLLSCQFTLINAQDTANEQGIDTLERYQLHYGFMEDHMKNFQWDSALFYAEGLMNELENSSYKKEIAILTYKRSILHYAKGDYEEALQFIFKAIEQSNDLNDEKQLGVSYFHLGNLYYFLQNYNSAEEYYLLGRGYLEKVGDAYGVAKCNSNIGLIAINRNDFSKGEEYQKKALVEIEKSGNEVALGNTYHYLAKTYLGLLNYDSASFYVEKSIASNKKTAYLAGLSFDHLIKAEIELSRNNKEGVIELLKQARDYWKEQPEIDVEKGLLFFESRFFESEKDYEKAFRALKSYNSLKDSSEVNNDKMRILALQQKSSLWEVQYELKQAKEKVEKNKQDSASLEKQIWISTIVAAVSLVLLLITLIVNKRNKKLNKELGSQKDEIRNQLLVKQSLLSEIHHRVKNNLQVISSMLSLQSQHINDDRLEEVISVCKARITSMSLIHESLYKREEGSTPLFSDYIEKLIPTLIDTYQIDQNKVKLAMNIEPIELSLDDSLPCGLIINEVVSNALKHAFPNGKDGIIAIRMERKGGMNCLRISDNGVGVSKEVDPQEQETFGFLLIYTLAEQMEAEVKLGSDSGLAFEFSWKHKES